MINGKDKYDSILERARREKDPNVKADWIIEILEMMATNDLPHIYKYLKLVNKKLTWGLVGVGLLAVFLLLTHPEVFNVFRAVKGV